MFSTNSICKIQLRKAAYMERYDKPFRSYEGHEPYIFISYSHRDSERVFEIIGHLHNLGYRIWYDEGIDPGTEWPEEIAMHLKESAVFLLFVSENSMKSHNVRREINYAIDMKNRLICVYLEETQLSPGMQMQLSLIQSIYCSYPNTDDFFRRMEKVLNESPVLGTTDGIEQAVKSKPYVSRMGKKKVSPKALALYIAAGLIVVSALAFGIGALIKMNTSDPAKTIDGQGITTNSISSANEDIDGNPDAQLLTPAEIIAVESNLSMPEVANGELGNNPTISNKMFPAGSMASKGGYTYITHQNAIYRIDETTSQVKYIAATNTNDSLINVAGDYLYYFSGGYNRIKTDGTDYAIVPEIAFGMPIISVGEWLYVNAASSEEGLYRVSLDGKQKQSIYTGINTYYFYPSGDWIYFNDYNDTTLIWRIKNDGTQLEKFITDLENWSYHIVDGYLYYFSKSYGQCRMDLESGEKKRLNTELMSFFDTVIVDGYIYYTNVMDDFVDIKRVGIESGIPEDICSATQSYISSISVGGGYVYYSEDSTIYRCPVTGGEPENITAFLATAS